MHPDKPISSENPESLEVERPQLPFDPLRVLYGIIKGWHWMLLGAIVFGIIGYFIAQHKFKDKHLITGKLIRREISGSFRTTQTGESFKPQGITAETLVSLMYSKALMIKAGQRVNPPIPISEISGHLMIEPERRTDLIRVTFDSTRTPEQTLSFLNNYLNEVVDLTRNLLRTEARSMQSFLDKKLVELDKEIWDVYEQILDFAKKSNLIHADKETDAYLRDLGTLELRLETSRAEYDTIEIRIRHLERALRKQNPALLELNQARELLRLLQLEYTDKHPKVIQQRAQIASLEIESKESQNLDPEGLVAQGDTVSNTLYLDMVALKSKKESLDEQMKQLDVYRQDLRNRLMELPNKSLKNQQLQSKLAHLQEARNVLASRQIETEAFADSPIGYYSMVTPPQLSSVETESSLLKIIIITVAFAIMGVCLTVIGLITKVFTSKFLITPNEFQVALKCKSIELKCEDEDLSLVANRTAEKIIQTCKHYKHEHWVIGFKALLKNTSISSQFFELLVDAAKNSEYSVRAIPLSEVDEIQTFKVESKKEFKDEASDVQNPKPQVISHTSNSSSTKKPQLILIELPQSSIEEKTQAGLLKKLDTMLYIVTDKTAQKSEIKTISEKMNSYSIKPMGLVFLNISAFFKHTEPLQNWIRKLANKAANTSLVLTGLGISILNQSHAANVENSTTTVSVPKQSWTEHYTLGPGDEMHIRFHGRDDLMRQFIQVAPDGRLSYLQAQSIKAEGLTIDELREILNKELEVYYQSPKIIITPTRFASKKFHLLGSVRDSGSYQLSGPTTLIEAIANARGFKTGYFDHNTVELADLARCFLVRNGEKLDIDFQKLFHEGDLNQNIYLEPEDYIYIPSSIVNEVYLLGEVMRPGAIGITTDATVMSVITIRNGFSERAFREKILVVRGSLNEPSTFVVNASDILDGKSPDFLLKPRDIIYIPEKPWNHPEEILDMAMKAFVQSAVASWTGANVGPFIRRK